MRPLSALVVAASLLVLAPGVQAAPDRSARDVTRALESGEAAQIRAVLSALATKLDGDLTRALIRGLTHVYQAGLYPELVACLATAHGDALREVADTYRSTRTAAERFLVLDVLSGHTDPLAEETLSQAVRTDREEAVSIYALRKLVGRGTARAIDELITILDETGRNRRKAQIASETLTALQQITGQRLEAASEWQHWWEAARDEWIRSQRAASSGGASDGAADRTRTRTVLDRMRDNDPRGLTTLTRLRGDEIVVIRGGYDSCERVLSALKLPHRVHRRQALRTLELDPSKQILVLNCAADDNQPPEVAAKIREFVAQGGYLFASDWELTSLLARAFPEVVKSAGRNAPEVRITIQPPGNRPSTHPLLRDVFPLNPLEAPVGGATWLMDAQSEFMTPHRAITVLVEAPELRVPIVACTFGFSPRGPVTGEAWATPRATSGAGTRTGRGGGGANARPPGRVVYVMGHFRHQADESGDGFALQQLLLNLVIEKQEFRRALGE